MPRANPGPRLRKFRPHSGYTEPLWFAVWSERGVQKRRSSGTAVDAEAHRWFQEVFLPKWRAAKHRAERDGQGPRDPAEVPVAEVLDRYNTDHAPDTADPARIGYAVNALLGFWSELSVAEVGRKSCREYATWRRRADATVRKELQTLGAALRFCHGEGVFTRLPELWLPEQPPGEETWLERHEAAALLRAARRSGQARRHLPLFILIGLYTGARSKASILPLQWQSNTAGGHVDLARGRIDFNPLRRKQTKKKRPKIPVPPRLRPFLRQARRRTTSHVLEFHGARILSVKKGFASAAVAAAEELEAWAAAIDIGLPETADRRRAETLARLHGCRVVDLPQLLRASAAKLAGEVTPHVLRHTTCTWMMHAGVPVWEAAGFVGMTPATFHRVYGHHHPDYMRAAAEAFGAGGGKERA